MSSDDLEYFRQRAAVERGMAKAATDAIAAAIHDELARGYEALVRRDEMRLVTPATLPDQDRAQDQRTASA